MPSNSSTTLLKDIETACKNLFVNRKSNTNVRSRYLQEAEFLINQLSTIEINDEPRSREILTYLFKCTLFSPREDVEKIVNLINKIFKTPNTCFDEKFVHQENTYYTIDTILRLKNDELIINYVNSTESNMACNVHKIADHCLNNNTPNELINKILDNNNDDKNKFKTALFTELLKRSLTNYNDKNDDFIVKLIKNGAYLKFKFLSYSTALHWAIEKGKEELVKAMIYSPLCSWKTTSAYKTGALLTPYQLACQLSSNSNNKINFITQLIEGRETDFLTHLLNNKQEVSRIFYDILHYLTSVKQSENQIYQHDFYQGLTHRLIRDYPLTELNKKTIQLLVNQGIVSIDKEVEGMTPLQVVMNQTQLPDAEQLIFLMNLGATMTVINNESHTLLQQIMFSDMPLTKQHQAFLHHLISKHPKLLKVEISESESKSIFATYTERPAVSKDGILLLFALEARVFFENLLNSTTGGEQYNTNYLLGLSKTINDRLENNYTKTCRGIAFKILEKLVNSRPANSRPDLQTNLAQRLLENALNDALFATHGDLGRHFAPDSTLGRFGLYTRSKTKVQQSIQTLLNDMSRNSKMVISDNKEPERFPSL